MILTRRALLQASASVGLAIPFVSSTALGRSHADKILRIGISDYPSTLRPAYRSSGTATSFCWSLMHARLLRYSPSGELSGELAESWSSDGGTAWTFRLKPANFSNGAKVTAADLKYSIDRMSSDELSYSDRGLYKTIVSTEIVDELTVRVVTSSPNATIPAVLAMPHFYVIAEKSDTAENEAGIGAGPYILNKFERGVGLTYTANENYFGGAPHFKTVQVTSFIDENLRVAALLSGDLDLIDYVPWNSMGMVEEHSGTQLAQEPEGGFMWMYFSGRGPFKDSRLRKAVAYGIRREEIVNGVFYGRGSPMYGLPRPRAGGYYHEDQANYWSYNPELSRKLMAEAGVGGGFSCSLLSTSTYGFHRDTAVIVASHLKELGINVELLLPDWATHTAMAQRGEGDFGLNGSGLTSLDPATLTTIDPSLPLTRRSHDFEVSGLTAEIAKGVRELNPEARREIYRNVDQLVLDNSTFVGLAYRGTGFGLSKKIKGFELLPSLISPFSYYHLSALTSAS